MPVPQADGLVDQVWNVDTFMRFELSILPPENSQPQVTEWHQDTVPHVNSLEWHQDTVPKIHQSGLKTPHGNSS
eukprot:3249208-Amphidinium_carterae.1